MSGLGAKATLTVSIFGADGVQFHVPGLSNRDATLSNYQGPRSFVKIEQL